MGRRRKEQASLDLAPAVEAEIEFAPEAEPEVLPDSVEAQEGAPTAPPSIWMVLEDKVVSLFGQITTLPAGTIVSARSYGPQGVKRIMEQGVMMEPVG